VASALQTALGECEVMQNAIPAAWQNMGPFKGRTEFMHADKLLLHPYIGAFEIYHEDNLLYSKLSSRLWPNCKAVADKIRSYFADKKNKADVSKYKIKYNHPVSKLPSII